MIRRAATRTVSGAGVRPRPRAAAFRALALPCALLFASATCGATDAARAPATAASRAEPSHAAAGGATARLEAPKIVGQGLLRWFGLRVYEATLWVSGGRLDPASPLSNEFALELRYARAIEGAAIAEASLREIVRLGFGTKAQHAAWLQAMRSLFPDVREGDRIAGVHRPGRGVEFFGNDQPIGRIDDPDFAAAFFAIWFDQRTAAPELRRALLAGPPPSRPAGESSR